MRASSALDSAFLVIQLALVAGLVSVAGRFTGRMPQHASGEDALSVAFGDAKAVLSRMAYHKADSYFHGGVDMECKHLHDHEAHDDCRGEEPDSDHDHDFFRDPWSWINHHVRAPEVDRHLAGTKAVELMPWFWASVRADPHNIEAWETTMYVASHVMKDRELALRVIGEAKAKNPDSARIALTEGQFLYDRGAGDVPAARRCFERAVQLAPKDSQTYEFARRYLDDIEKHYAESAP